MMLHALKTPAALVACLVVAAACASGSVSQQDALTTGVNAASVTEKGVLPKASPVDLGRLAALARSADESLVEDAQTETVIESRITPATTVTYETEAPIEFDAEAGYKSESLIVVPYDSDLLRGTVYESGATQAKRKPFMTPGTYRTIEYKN